MRAEILSSNEKNRSEKDVDSLKQVGEKQRIVIECASSNQTVATRRSVHSLCIFQVNVECSMGSLSLAKGELYGVAFPSGYDGSQKKLYMAGPQVLRNRLSRFQVSHDVLPREGNAVSFENWCRSLCYLQIFNDVPCSHAGSAPCACSLFL